MAPYTHPAFEKWSNYLSHARNGNDRPVSGANNTRVHWSGEDAISFRLHNTDVVTLNRDGTRELRTGGWDTMTTKQRIAQFGSRHVVGGIETSRSYAGPWYVRAEDDPKDPHPLGPGHHWRGAHAHRSIPKPFTVLDPGPEPVDDREGCIAGEREEFEAGMYQAVYDWNDGPQSWEYVTNRYYADGSGPRRMIHRAYMTGIAWGETGYNSEWGSDRDKHVEVPPGWTYKQCPHCVRFRALHDHWQQRMHGAHWGRHSEHGYRQMCEWLEEFGDREAWQHAYIEEFRAVRALNKRAKEWDERNWLPFYDGITVTPQGLVPLKVKREHCKALRAEARAEARRQRIHRKRERINARNERKRCEERRTRRIIAEALANDLISVMEEKRTEYPNWRNR